jgi:hypothetical protein
LCAARVTSAPRRRVRNLSRQGQGELYPIKVGRSVGQIPVLSNSRTPCNIRSCVSYVKRKPPRARARFCVSIGKGRLLGKSPRTSKCSHPPIATAREIRQMRQARVRFGAMVTNLGIRCEHFRLRGDLLNRGQHERISRSGASDGLADAGKADGEPTASGQRARAASTSRS